MHDSGRTNGSRHGDESSGARAAAAAAPDASFASFFAQSICGVALLDARGVHERVNDRYCEIFARARDELLRVCAPDLAHEENRDDVRERLRALVERRAERCAFEMRCTRRDGVAADGADACVRAEWSALRDASGALAGICVVVVDVSAQKRLEDELASRDEELANAGGAMDSVLSVLSHELRSPLNIIRLWSQLLQRPGTSAESLRSGLEIIDRSSKTQAQMIEDLLDVHRVASTKVALERVPLDVARTLASAVEAMRASAAEKELGVELDVASAPAIVHADAARLLQVFGNVLGNSIRYAPRGSVIRVSLRVHDAHAWIRVHDGGEAISAAAIRQLAEPFRRADVSSSGSQRGLGLGLAVAKQFVELHGGTLRASGAEAGTEFTVSLPLASARTS